MKRHRKSESKTNQIRSSDRKHLLYHRDFQSEGIVDNDEHNRCNGGHRLDKYSRHGALDSSHDSHIQNWLTQITDTAASAKSQFGIVKDEAVPKWQEDTNLQCPSKKGRILLEGQHTKYEAPLDCSSDSSFLEPGLPIKNRDCQANIESADSLYGKHGYEMKRKRSKPQSQTGNSHHIFASKLNETFERRKRHKTREDCYEPKKRLQYNANLETRLKRVRHGNRRRRTKQTGKLLMPNFSAKSVGIDRVTIRPNHGPGLFNNGRASSPSRRRALPDLEFSEMDFLHRSRRNPSENQDNDNLSKTQGKEKKNVQCAQEEISAFFKPVTKDLKRRHLAKDTEKQMKLIRSFKVKSRSARRGSIYSISSSTSINQPRVPYFDSESRAFTSTPPFTLYDLRRSTPTSGKAAADPDTRRSNQSSTYYSWSRTFRSSPKDDSPTYTRHIVAPKHSVTPDHIRISLEETGIFESTGIQRGSSGQGQEIAADNYQLCHQRGNSSRHNIQTRPCINSMPRLSPQISPASKTQKGNSFHKMDSPSSVPSLNMHHRSTRAETANESESLVVGVKHFDPLSDLEMQQSETSHSHQEPHINLSDAERPSSRLVIAQKAYVKRAITAKTASHIVLNENPRTILSTEHNDGSHAAQKDPTSRTHTQGIATGLAISAHLRRDRERIEADHEVEIPTRKSPSLASVQRNSHQIDPSLCPRPTLNLDPLIQEDTMAHNHFAPAVPQDTTSNTEGLNYNDICSEMAENETQRSPLTYSNELHGFPLRGIWPDCIKSSNVYTLSSTFANTAEPLYQHQLKSQLPGELKAPTSDQYGYLNWRDQQVEDAFIEETMGEEGLTSETVEDKQFEGVKDMISPYSYAVGKDRDHWYQKLQEIEYGAGEFYSDNGVKTPDEKLNEPLVFEGQSVNQPTNSTFERLSRINKDYNARSHYSDHDTRNQVADAPFPGFWRPFRHY